MSQYDLKISDYERIIRKRYKLILTSTILSIIVCAILGSMKEKQYEASASIKIDKSGILGLSPEQAYLYDLWENITAITKDLTSHAVMTIVAKKLQIIPDTVSDDIVHMDRNSLGKVRQLQGLLSTSIDNNTNIITLSAKSTDPKIVYQLVNSTVYAFEEYSLQKRKKNIINTKQFIENQMNRIQNEMDDIQEEIQELEENNDLPSLDAHQKRLVDQSVNLTNEVDKVENSLKVIAIQKRKLRDIRLLDPTRLSRFTDSTTFADSMMVQSMGWISEFVDQDQGIMTLNKRLIDLQISLSEKTSYYKQNHPAIKAILSQILQTIKEITTEYDEKERDLQSRLSEIKIKKEMILEELRSIPSNQMEVERLRHTFAMKEDIYSMFNKKLQETMIAESSIASGVAIMSIADPPTAPLNDGFVKIVLVGAILGLIIGLIFAVFKELMDTSIGTIEEVERTLQINVLAGVPHIEALIQKKTSQRAFQNISDGNRKYLVTHLNPKEISAEAFRILRTNLEYLSYTTPLKTMLLTSATMQEGKSTSISNLAIAYSQQGKKVLLLECNLRRPSLLKVFGLQECNGVSDILIGKVDWRDCVKTITDLILGEFSVDEILSIPGLANFHYISYGHRPPNPTELLASKKLDELLEELKSVFDIILVDGPPLLPVADSFVLAKKVDGIVLVYKVGKVPRNSLWLAKERLEAVKARILGLVLNDIRLETAGSAYSKFSMRAYVQQDENIIQTRLPWLKKLKFWSKK